ncbi:MAG TPA: ATP-binding protein [Bacteroidales bacterium]|nr:ATP-binding protein [Bacteroidales bacterium]
MNRIGSTSGMVDAEILGRIMVAQNILFVLPSSETIIEFFNKSLAEIPGTGSVHVCLSGGKKNIYSKECSECHLLDSGTKGFMDKNGECRFHTDQKFFVFLIETLEFRFGFIVFSLIHKELFNPYVPFIGNLTNFIALTLENRLHKSSLEKTHENLEQRVLERTIELRNVNRQLQEENKARAITEGKLRLLSNALEASANSIVITDKAGNINWANKAFSTLTGYSPEEALGRNPGSLVKSGVQSIEFYKQMWNTILDGNVWQGEIVNKKKDGSLYDEYLTITPLFSETGKISHFIAVKLDITEQKKSANELLKAKEKAEESNRLKSAFLATMNHELRTPLNHILGFSDLMKSGINAAQVIDYATLIHKSGNNLLEIIEDIFELALAEQSVIKLRSESINCLDLFISNKSVLTEILNASGKKDQIKLNFNADKELLVQSIYTDRSKINQVLINLFRNAVKFTEQGKIEFGMTQQEPGYITFYVKDTGIGIPENKNEIIFEFFRQVDESPTRKHGGVGIGLAISKKIAAIMDGTLTLESEPGKGSIFSFKIPVILNNVSILELKNAGAVKDFPDFKNKTILIAEDDNASLLLIRKYLSPTGAKIIDVPNGAAAIDRLSCQPDIVLMDMNMPVINGYDATRAIKKDHTIPILATTSYSLPDDREKAIEAGCDGFIMKPINQQKLLDELSRFLLK